MTIYRTIYDQVWPITTRYDYIWLDSRMNSEVHNDTAPDSGGGVSAFETMVTEYREGQEKTRANNRSAPRVGIR